DDTARAIREAGGTAHLFAADLTELAANQQLARDVVEALGGLDVLVCNAAYQMTFDSLEAFPPEQIQRTFATNVFSTFWLVQALAGDLEKDGGSVIVTTSVQAYQPSEQLLD